MKKLKKSTENSVVKECKALWISKKETREYLLTFQ